MGNWNELLTIGLGLLLRIGIPLSATILLILFLRRLDNRWKAEAKESLDRNGYPVASASKPCWEVKNCSQEQKKRCPAAVQNANPCWQFFRTEQGALKETCLGCNVFKQAPLPIGIKYLQIEEMSK
jgi:hypothetical protein